MEPLPPLASAFSNDLVGLGRYYRDYQRLVAHWREHLDLQWLDVDYESIVRDQEATTRRLVDFCGLEWDDACLAFQDARRTEHTASVHQVRRAIYGSSVGRAERFGSRLDPLREALAGNEVAR
jgi:hypothetical protein